MTTLVVPDSFVVYRCKISAGRVLELALPADLAARDVDRISAFLATQCEPDSPTISTATPEPEPAVEPSIEVVEISTVHYPLVVERPVLGRPSVLDEIKQIVVAKAVEADGTISGAARTLGVPRSTIQRIMGSTTRSQRAYTQHQRCSICVSEGADGSGHNARGHMRWMAMPTPRALPAPAETAGTPVYMTPEHEHEHDHVLGLEIAVDDADAFREGAESGRESPDRADAVGGGHDRSDDAAIGNVAEPHDAPEGSSAESTPPLTSPSSELVRTTTEAASLAMTSRKEICSKHGWVGSLAYWRNRHDLCDTPRTVPMPKIGRPRAPDPTGPMQQPVFEKVMHPGSGKMRPRRHPDQPRSETTPIKALTRAVMRDGEEEIGGEVPDEPRPRTRADCEGGERPCPYVSCKYNLYLDVTETGSIQINFPNLEPWELANSCALDVADNGGATLEETGRMLNVTRERIRQLEVKALFKVRRDPRVGRDMDAGDVGRASPDNG